MADKFQNKYRIPSARHPNWDYGTNGAYFITICTKDRQYFFGESENGKMKLSTVGAIAQGFWYEIPKHFPFIELGEFVVMPNHIHGVLILNKNKFDENIILPDDSNWIPETDMTRFTDVQHPQFWRSDSLDSPAYRGDALTSE